MNNRLLRVSKAVFDEYLRGKRSLLIRPSSDLEGVQLNGVLALTSGNHTARYTVRAVRKHPDLTTAVASEVWALAYPHCTDAEQVLAILRELYSLDGRLQNVTVVNLVRQR